MQKMSRKIPAIVATLVVLAALGGASLRADVIEQVLVKVNGEIFTKSDLEQRQIAALRARNRGVTENDLKNDAELRADLRRRGLLRAGQFTWNRVAAQTLEVYRAARREVN